MKIIILTILGFFLAINAEAHSLEQSDTLKAKEIRFPLLESDSRTPFTYFNNEWILSASLEMVRPEDIMNMEVKDDEYGNRAIFVTVSDSTLQAVKESAQKATEGLFVDNDPVCEFPGGMAKMLEWLDENIQVPASVKDTERVVVTFKVQTDGTVTDGEIFKASDNDDVNKEALRLVNSLPKFYVRFYTPRKHVQKMAWPIKFTNPAIIHIK